MHKNFLWICFLSLITGAVGWFTLKTLYAVYLYALLTGETTPESIEWKINQLHEDQFILSADYHFNINQHKYLGQTSFKSDRYWNLWAAEDALKVYSQKEWPVWYAKSNPEISTLQKSFPLKECISVAILWILMFYFFGLGYYVAKTKINR